MQIRKKIGTGAAALVLIACGLPPAQAADPDGLFAIKGGGLQTCAAFLTAAAADSPDIAAYGGWIEGYLTGQNQSAEGIFDIAPWQSTASLLSLVGSVCDALPPETRFVDALNELVRVLAPNALRAESDLVALRRGERGTLLYRATIAEIQQALRQQGHEIADADGDYGETTAAAIEAYQTTIEAEPTGLPDQKSLFELLLRR